MEVRWRLFARDVLSLLADSDGKFHFGRPPRPIGGLRLLGVAVHKARSGVANDPASRAGAAGAAGDVRDGKKRARGDDDGGYCSGNGSAVEGEFGLLGIDDGTGVVEVRMPLRLWEAVALGDQLDIVGVPERPKALASTSNSPPAAAARPRRPRRGVSIKADGCYVEKDPNVATLRALECINLYKTCYFSRAWSPSAAPLPPLLLDPQPPERADGRNIGDGGVGADGGTTAATSAGDVEPHLHGGRGGSAAPPLEDILGLIGSLGGATAEQLVAKLGLPPGHAGVASALDQMQLDGAIYLAGDLFMPL